MKPILICMGSKSDYPVMKDCEAILEDFKIPFETQILSAHRTPLEMYKVGTSAHQKYSIVIAAAGGAAHLPGMMAALTRLPVIGVPTNIGRLKGLDALLSIAQMPKGIPVATVAVDNSANAALLAARILGITDERIARLMEKYQESLEGKVFVMRKELTAEKRKAKKLTKRRSPKI